MAVLSTGLRKTSGEEHSDLARVEFQILIHFQVESSSRRVNKESGDWRHKCGSRHINDGNLHRVSAEEISRDHQGGKRRQTKEVMC